jgi:hypothetical protein
VLKQMLLWLSVCTPSRSARKRSRADILAPGNNGPHRRSSSSGMSAGAEDRCDKSICFSTADIALREGVHTLSQLRVTGANEEFDFVLRCVSPVLWLVLPGDAHGPARYWTLWLGLASITTDQLDCTPDTWAVLLLRV